MAQNIPLKDKLDFGKNFKVSLMKEVIKPTVPHRHAGYHELIFLSQGAGFHEIDGTMHDITAPIAYYLRPGQTHCWNFTAIPKGYVILFQEELLLREDISALLNFPSSITLQQPDTFFQLAASLFNEPYSVTTIQAYIHLFVSKLYQSLLNYKPDLQPASNLIQQFKQLVNTHFADRKELLFYASQLQISTAVLNSICKKELAKTPGAILNERVLLEAKLLLSATEKPVNDVALELGFADSPHFIKFFKQHTHLTPRAFREMSRSRQ